MKPDPATGAEKIRLDKWLWQARLCKTRTLAANLCAAGQVIIGDQAVKPAQTIRTGSTIIITHGGYRRSLVVAALGNRRGPATEAQALYQETSRQKIKDLEPPWERLLTGDAEECDDLTYRFKEAEG